MKRQTFFNYLLIAFISLLASSVFANSDAKYPINNAFYTPTAIAPAATYSAPADFTISTHNLSSATVRVSGTCTGLTAAVQGSNDATNWTTLQAIPVAGGSVITSVTGTGFWRVNVAGFTKARLHITVLSASCTVAMAGTQAAGAVYLMNPNTTSNPTSIVDSTATYNWAIDSVGIGSVKVTNGTQSLPTMDAVARPGFQKITDGTSVAGVTAASTAAVAATPALVVTDSPNAVDPCQSPGVAKSSAVINQSSSATTKVVDTSTTKTIYVCSFVLTASGTTPTFTFIKGTHVSADCDTGAGNLSGAMVPSATVGTVSYSPGLSAFKSGAGDQVCLTTGATTSVQGILTYVQQ